MNTRKRKQLQRKAKKLARDRCCNIGHYRDVKDFCWIFGEKCRVVEGKTCEWFRKAVLPLDVELQAQITGTIHTVNCCARCGKVIAPRKKYCEKCLRRREKARRLKELNL